MPVDGVRRTNPSPPPPPRKRTAGPRGSVPMAWWDTDDERDRQQRRYQDEVSGLLRDDVKRLADAAIGDKRHALWIASTGEGRKIVVAHGLKRVPTSFSVLARRGGDFTPYVKARNFANARTMTLWSDAPRGVEWLIVPD